MPSGSSHASWLPARVALTTFLPPRHVCSAAARGADAWRHRQASQKSMRHVLSLTRPPGKQPSADMRASPRVARRVLAAAAPALACMQQLPLSLRWSSSRHPPRHPESLRPQPAAATDRAAQRHCSAATCVPRRRRLRCTAAHPAPRPTSPSPNPGLRHCLGQPAPRAACSHSRQGHTPGRPAAAVVRNGGRAALCWIGPVNPGVPDGSSQP